MEARGKGAGEASGQKGASPNYGCTLSLSETYAHLVSIARCGARRRFGDTTCCTMLRVRVLCACRSPGDPLFVQRGSGGWGLSGADVLGFKPSAIHKVLTTTRFRARYVRSGALARVLGYAHHLPRRQISRNGRPTSPFLR